LTKLTPLSGERATSNHQFSKNVSMCLLNPWSICNKSLEINDFISDQDLDILAITETWLSGNITDNAVISALLPKGYSIIHQPRLTRGGGTGVIFRDNIKIKQVTDTMKYESFEVLECTIRSDVMVRLCIIYRPLGHTSVKTFCDEFSDYLSYMCSLAQELLYWLVTSTFT
jgi:hypothetical protein